ncbi:DUF5954 family protein [Streptomyces aidingensis]|uniref:Aromatic ring-opening dioxygenase LigA n=1 Tax=Streptomyces aidingensis TaxID=910347 RepID=A0A1I1FQS2_9ACTN|nr:DUF5954 family protein [Streptomyces aidingensis]SFC01684.1 hypothetical protein SAMN05421773_101833 [Streptomyces aidingensis]
MFDDSVQWPDFLSVHVDRRGGPVSQVAEADAMDAAHRYPNVVLRGPVFGVAAQGPEDGRRWRVVIEVTAVCPQVARDSLNSLLWFRAKDDTDDPAERRELLAAVGRLDTERVDELTVRGTRFRVVRGDEYARVGEAGFESSRPTDREPPHLSWEPSRDRTPSPDKGFVIDHARATGAMESAERLAVRQLCYTGDRYPPAVREDSARAVRTHPGVVLLPVTFTVAEGSDSASWELVGGLHFTPHEARRSLYRCLTELWPMIYEYDDATRREYARAAERFRAAGRADEMTVSGRGFRILRTVRMVRIGPDGPEPPRPSDFNTSAPMKIHPTMDEHGNITMDESPEEPEEPGEWEEAGPGAAGMRDARG